jgi:hypothetical protein
MKLFSRISNNRALLVLCALGFLCVSSPLAISQEGGRPIILEVPGHWNRINKAQPTRGNRAHLSKKEIKDKERNRAGK